MCTETVSISTQDVVQRLYDKMMNLYHNHDHFFCCCCQHHCRRGHHRSDYHRLLLIFSLWKKNILHFPFLIMQTRNLSFTMLTVYLFFFFFFFFFVNCMKLWYLWTFNGPFRKNTLLKGVNLIFRSAKMSLSTWNPCTSCVRCFLNFPQTMCRIQMELHIRYPVCKSLFKSFIESSGFYSHTATYLVGTSWNQHRKCHLQYHAVLDFQEMEANMLERSILVWGWHHLDFQLCLFHHPIYIAKVTLCVNTKRLQN